MKKNDNFQFNVFCNDADILKVMEQHHISESNIIFLTNSRTAWFYLDQFPDSKNRRDYVPHCLVARGDGSIDVKER